MKLVRRMHGVLVCGVMALLAACGGGGTSSNPPPPPGPSTFVLVGSGDSPGRVTSFQLDAGTGALTQKATINVGGAPRYGGVGRSGEFLFVPNFSDGTINSLTIHTFGDLTSDALTSGLSSPVQTECHPNGNFVYALQSAGAVNVYSISGQGTLTLAFSVATPAGLPSRTAITPSGAFMYVGIVGNNVNPSGIQAYSVNSTSGALTPVGFNATAAGPGDLAVSPNSGFLISAEPSAGSSQVLVYPIQSDGSLGNAVGNEAAEATTTSLAISPSGRWVYAGNNGTGSVSGFGLGTDGTLTAASGSPFAAASGTSDLEVDPSEKFLLVSNTFGNNIMVFGIDSATGALTAAGTTTVSDGPVGVAIVRK